jgi:hypothetical protein
MATQAKNNKIAGIIAGSFFLAVAIALFYVTFSLRSEAQGRELKVNLAQLVSGEVKHGDYLVIADTGAVISASSNIVDEFGTPHGVAFLLNGITDYIFLIGLTDEFADTTGKQITTLAPGTLLPGPFYARVNTESDVAPAGTEEFAIRNGLSTGQPFFVLQTGITRTDTTVPFYLTLAFGILGLFFSFGSWWGLIKKSKQ